MSVFHPSCLLQTHFGYCSARHRGAVLGEAALRCLSIETSWILALKQSTIFSDTADTFGNMNAAKETHKNTTKHYFENVRKNALCSSVLVLTQSTRAAVALRVGRARASRAFSSIFPLLSRVLLLKSLSNDSLTFILCASYSFVVVDIFDCCRTRSRRRVARWQG